MALNLKTAWRALPPPVRTTIRLAKYTLEISGKLGGSVPRECPCCDTSGKFFAFGHPPRYDAQCPKCGSLERHRLLVLACERLGLVKPTDRLLHFAPEEVLMDYFKSKAGLYQTADLNPRHYAGLVRNIEAIEEDAASVDVVLANHVLEHVDDAKALGEIYRVLKPGGRLLVTVPMVEGWDKTYENPDIRDGKARELHFGQDDHVRYYGRDLRDRFLAAGFKLDEFVGSGEETVRYGLMRGERVFIGRKA